MSAQPSLSKSMLPSVGADLPAASEKSQSVVRENFLPEMNRYHQQYLFKVPNGYCGIGGTGVSCPVGLTTSSGE